MGSFQETYNEPVFNRFLMATFDAILCTLFCLVINHESKQREKRGAQHTDFGLACVASVSVRFRRKERGPKVKDLAKSGSSKRALVSFLARSKPKVPFLGISLLRNQTETLATQANFG